MIELIRTAQRLQEVCIELEVPFCFIGGFALQRWGQVRFTKDVDVSTYVGFGSERQFIDGFLARLPSRRPDAAEFAEINRVLVLRDPENGVGIDISLGAFDFEFQAIERASYFRYAPGADILTCSAEDLVLYKAFANRDQDWIDIAAVLVRQRGKLDLKFIDTELPPLANIKEEPAIVERWRTLRDKHR